MKKYVKSSNDGSNPTKALSTRVKLLRDVYNAMDELGYQDATMYEELDLLDKQEEVGLALREAVSELDQLVEPNLNY